MSRVGKTAAEVQVLGAGSTEAARAAGTLQAARRVLVTGLNEAPAAAIRAACDLAERLGAAIDTGTADLASPLGPVAVRAGAVTADAEDLRDRADLVVVWFCEPDVHRPGFTAAYLDPPLAGGRRRHVLAVGGAGGHLQLSGESALAAARLLHAILLGQPVPAENAAAAALADVCRELATAIRGATCVGFVTARAGDPLGLATWATRLLVRAIAHERPAFEVPLAEPSCGHGGDPGAGDVLTWRYGAAGGIARADRLGAAFRPAECSAATLIARGEVDAVLAVGHLPEAVEAALAARAADVNVVRIDDAASAADSLEAMLRDLGEPPGSGGAR